LEAAQELYNDAPVGFAVKQESSDQDLAELSTRFYDHDVDLLQNILVITRGELEIITDDDTKNVPGSLMAEVAPTVTSMSKIAQTCGDRSQAKVLIFFRFT